MSAPDRASASAGLQLAQAVMGTLGIALVALTAAISYPAVVFSGPLAPFLPNALATGLVGSAVVGATIAALGAYRGTVSYAQSAPTVMVSILVGAIAQQWPAGAGTLLFETTLAAVAAGALACGLVLAALGAFRLGNLIRYVPVPVIAGFLAGTGWTLVKSGIGTTSGVAVTFANLPLLAEPARIAHWLPGLLAGLALWLLSRLRPRPYNVALVLVGLAAGFWVVAALAGVDADALRAGGWLFQVRAGGWSPAIPAHALAAADWTVILRHAPQLLAVAAVTAVSALISISAIELATERDLDVNRELRVTGLANVLSALAAGLPGHSSEASSGLTYRMGMAHRSVGLAVAACCLAVIVFAAPLVNLVPRMLSGALVAWIGIGMLHTWLYERARAMSATDVAVTWIVLLTAIFLGIMEALAAGTAAGVVLFVVRYSRIPVARSALSGAVARSSVGRSAAHAEVLAREGAVIHVLKLHGFVFFGTAHALVRLVDRRLQDQSPALRHLLLDLRLVSGIDTSAAAGFAKLERKARQHGFRIALAQASPEVGRVLDSAFTPSARGSLVQVFPDLDRALEWAEDDLLALQGGARGALDGGFEALARRIFGEEGASRAVHWFEPLDLPAGAVLARMGDPASELFFIESGRIEVLLQRTGGGDIRVGAMEPGSLIGEMAAYLGTPRTASLVAAEPTRVRRLAFDRLQQLQVSEPVLVAALHRHIATELAGKLVDLHRLVRALDA